jgi:hypothetical protein
LPRIGPLEILDQLIHQEDVLNPAGGKADLGGRHRDFTPPPAATLRSLLARMVHQDPAHDLRGHRAEMRAVPPMRPSLIDHPEKRFVH